MTSRTSTGNEERRADFVAHYCEQYMSQLRAHIRENLPLLSEDSVSSLKPTLEYLVNQIVLPTIAVTVSQNKEDYMNKGLCFYSHLFSLPYVDIWKKLNSVADIEQIAQKEMESRIHGVKAMLSRLYRDIIVQQGNDILNMSFALGDLHNNKESTTIVELANNEKVVYKPVQCKTDIAVYKIIDWVNESLPHAPLRARTIEDMETYAYKEYIEVCRTVDSDDEIRGYYYRMGKLLGLGTILHINDGHMENILVKKEHPFWIDLEAAFNALDKETDIDGSSSYVENTMLLQDVSNRRGEFSIFSGIQGGTTRNKSWVAGFALNDGTDDIIIRYRKLSVGNITANRLFKGDTIVNPEDYEQEIVKGFCDISELIISKRHEFWNLLDELFSDQAMRIRVIIRATVFYSVVRLRSYQPQERSNNRYWTDIRDFLSNNDNVRGLEEVCTKFIVSSEIYDLERGTVPIFYRDLHTKRLYNSKKEFIDAFYRIDVYSYFKRFISEIDDSFVQRNVQSIRKCLASTRNFDYEADLKGWIE